MHFRSYNLLVKLVPNSESAYRNFCIMASTENDKNEIK